MLPTPNLFEHFPRISIFIVSFQTFTKILIYKIWFLYQVINIILIFFNCLIFIMTCSQTKRAETKTTYKLMYLTKLFKKIVIKLLDVWINNHFIRTHWTPSTRTSSISSWSFESVSTTGKLPPASLATRNACTISGATLWTRLAGWTRPVSPAEYKFVVI